MFLRGCFRYPDKNKTLFFLNVPSPINEQITIKSQLICYDVLFVLLEQLISLYIAISHIGLSNTSLIKIQFLSNNKYKIRIGNYKVISFYDFQLMHRNFVYFRRCQTLII